MSARTRTDVLPYIFLIPVCGYFLPGTSRTQEGEPGGCEQGSNRDPACSLTIGTRVWHEFMVQSRDQM